MSVRITPKINPRIVLLCANRVIDESNSRLEHGSTTPVKKSKELRCALWFDLGPNTLRLIPPQSPRLAHDIFDLGQEDFFQRRRKRYRSIGRSNASNRSVERIETLFVDDGRDFACDAAGLRVLV